MRVNSPSYKRFLSLLLAISAVLIFLGAGTAAAQTFAPSEQPSSQPYYNPQASGAVVSQAQSNAGTGMILTDPVLGGASNKVYTGERISLDFQNADIHNILRLIGEVSGKNVVVSDQVTGKVTLKLKDVPWDQALDIVLASKNLDKAEHGNVIRIDTIAAIRSATSSYTDPTIPVPLYKKMYTPKYSSVSSLAAEMAKVIQDKSGSSVRVIGNDIYVEADNDSLRALNEVFIRNDKVTKQILIEARIVEASTRFMQQLGIRWGTAYDHVIGGGSNLGGREALASASSQTQGDYLPGEFYGAMTQIAGAGNLGVGFVNKAGTLMLNAELNVTESVGETRIVSSPRIMASNDEEVYIKQGQQIPYVTGGTTAGTTASTEFKDAAMELRVTPHIEENGEIVTLEITLTKDSIAGNAPGSGELLIDKKEAKTKLMVKNGETVVIGGIITDEQTTSDNRIPGLHALPLLGWLFQDSGVTNAKTELLIFMTANIIPITI
jgi:type IV pilus assembly protein PilQ